MGKLDDYLLYYNINQFNQIHFLIFYEINGGNKSFYFRYIKTRKDQAFRSLVKRKTILQFQKMEADLGYGKGADCRAKNKGKRGRNEVQRRKKSSQNTMALMPTETRRHVQETSYRQLYHSAVGFHLISLFPAQCLTPLPTTPGVPQVWSLSGSLFSMKYLLSLPGQKREWRPFIQTFNQSLFFSAVLHLHFPQCPATSFWGSSGALGAMNKAFLLPTDILPPKHLGPLTSSSYDSFICFSYLYIVVQITEVF